MLATSNTTKERHSRRMKATMRSVYTRLQSQLEQQFAVVVLCIVVGAAIFLQPTVAASWNTYRSSAQLAEFIQEIQATDSLAPQTYWQFRQSYSPGHFRINPTAVGHGMTYSIDQLTSEKTELLYFESSQLTSTDAVISDNSELSALLESDALPEVIHQTNTLLLTQDPQRRLYRLSFVQSIEQMRQANGFFDYTPEETELLADQLWYNTTLISY